jgi:GTP-binding protein
VAAFLKAYRWKGPAFAIAAVNGDGCRELTYAIQVWLDAHPADPGANAADETTAVVVSPAPVRARRRRSTDA